VQVFLSRAHFPVTTLGPGQRLGIWFQGCSIRCPGCISVDTWAFGQGEIEVSEFLESVAPWIAMADGITITGGEPFDQVDALFELLSKLRTVTSSDVLIFTGYPREHLPPLERFAGLVDGLMTDPYRADLPQQLALRGSDNQRLHCLTQRGAERFREYERSRTQSDNRLDVLVDESGTVWMAGIPRRGDMPRLIANLRALGHEAHGTFDTRPRD
jgi:anaerobic ribonucleoside-triphosphate reductase activating protein